MILRNILILNHNYRLIFRQFVGGILPLRQDAAGRTRRLHRFAILLSRSQGAHRALSNIDTHSNQQPRNASLYSVKLGKLWAMVVRRLDTPPVEAFEQGFELGLGHGNVCLR